MFRALAVSLAVLFAPIALPCPAQSAAVQSPTGIDYSYAGYAGGGVPLPQVAAVLTVRPTGHDDTALLQGALDRIAAMPLGSNGFRGALLLAPGQYHLAGSLALRAAGVVLRGAAPGRTVLLATGLSRRSLLVVGGRADPALGAPVEIAADAPAGSRAVTLVSTTGLTVGDRIVITRPSTREWIGAIAMSNLPGTFANQRLDWQPGSHDLQWDRTVTAVDPARNRVEFDAPITTALETIYGGGTLRKVQGSAPVTHIGIENLTLESEFSSAQPKDEDHSWIAVQLDHVEDAWVRSVTARHFAGSAVRVNWRARRITVSDCRSEAPVSEEGGYRRQAFLVDGQQVLVTRCWSERGMNDFASGLLAAGPNVFLDCDAAGSLGASGSFEGWASGVLYERVHVPNARLQLVLDQARAQGGGWTAANSVAWNSTARSVDALGPPGAPNYAVTASTPLYDSQLAARTHIAPRLAAHDDSPKGIAEFRPGDLRPAAEAPPVIEPVQIVNGRFVHEGKVLWGPSQGEAWWRGDTSPLTAAQSTGSSVSRFMPGVTAPGETEDLAEMASRLRARGIVTIQVTPGLWYEHRRDSHNVERRDDGNVWAPFYEMPWARSGQGFAWDGLSKYDLSRYNPWYFERHREFAREAALKGFVDVYELYNTHDVLEIQPHYIDFAWRPANNINQTGLPEPPPFEPHNTNNIGNQFFSAADPALRALHRAYMLHTFDELADQPNVIFSMAYQYAGPLAFEQFFQDVAAEWSAQHGGKPIRIALITGKNTTDAILADPVRSKQVAMVDMRYWEYRPDGTLWAPDAGQNLAFRKIIQSQFPGYSDTPPATTAEMVYRQLREYRDRYPDIALMPMEEGAGPLPLLMGGAASQSALVGGRAPVPVPAAGQELSNARVAARATPPAVADRSNPDRLLEGFVREHLATVLMKMSPRDGWTAQPEQTWVLAGGAAEPVLIYSLSGHGVLLSRTLPAPRYKATWFDPRTGTLQPSQTTSGTSGTAIDKPTEEPWLLLLEPSDVLPKVSASGFVADH